MTDAHDHDDTVVSSRRHATSSTGGAADSIDDDDDTVVGRRRGGSVADPDAGSGAPTPTRSAPVTGRRAYAPDAEALRSPVPPRHPHPVIVARRSAFTDESE